MAKYCAKKGIQLIIVMILISFFSFAVIYAAPGDVSSMYINEQMSDEEKEELSELLKSKKENTSECDDKECNCDSSDEANNENSDNNESENKD